MQNTFITNKDIECETTDTCKAKIRVAHGSILNQIRYTCYYDIRYFGYSELNLLVPIWLQYNQVWLYTLFFKTTNINSFCEKKNLFTVCVRIKYL